MKIKSVLKRALPLAALGLLLLPSAPASAATYEHGPWYSADSAPHEGTVYVHENGDIVKLCDTKSDAYHAKAYVYTGPTDNLQQVYWFTNWYNDGKCSYAKASNGGDENLQEGKKYYVQICREENGGTQFEDKCTSYTHYWFLNDN
ncbi:hypothetical protein OG417_01285 [Actinoallomurus sp. NBC_01490]|jgi:hypothetical protein|uniref:hypothetical protein n=1 Tax=Actinoallomurus sp. NBC_01490 TaxID=2903557 RepID=UPI002E2ED864|nr:hypothetical protein [Actinoallomurus sp. NBC_01490]